MAYSTGSDDRKTKHDRIALAASGDIDLIEYYPEFCSEFRRRGGRACLTKEASARHGSCPLCPVN